MMHKQSSQRPQTTHRYTKLRGFSLLELAVVFVIAGLIGAMVMTLGMKWAEREENMSTKRKIETIQIALENFSRANNRLPCPADLSLTSDHAQYGVEANGLGGCNDGAVPDAIIAPSYTVYGAVPVATLGMSESMTKDQWGNMILYYVDKRMTDDMAFALFPPANTTVGDIIVEDESGNPRTSQAIYALLSFGANELGAIREGGTNDTEAPAPDHALEQRNTNRDGSGNSLEPMDADIVRKLVQASYKDGGFDDWVAYKTRAYMLEELASGNLGCADQQVNWTDNVTPPAYSCTADLVRDPDMVHGDGPVTLTDSSGTDVGSVDVSCKNGSLVLNNAVCGPPASNCPIGTSYSWDNCSGTNTVAIVHNAPGTATDDDTTGGFTGAADVICNNGTLEADPGGSWTCTANCTGGTNRTWLSGEAEDCVGTLPAVIGHDDTVTLNDNDGQAQGTADYKCNGVTDSIGLVTGTDSCLYSFNNCISEVVNWGAGNECSATIGPLNHGDPEVLGAANESPGYSGTTDYTCVDGSYVLNDMVCVPNCPAETPLTWIDDGTGDTCSADVAETEDGISVDLTDPTGGSVTAICNAGVWDKTNKICTNGTGGGGTCIEAYTPTPLATGMWNHNCGISTDKSMYCWGKNINGQLGNNSTVDSSVPVAVNLPDGVTGFKHTATGINNVCGIGDDNKAYCWGAGSNGQLGNGTTSDSHIPVQVNLPTGVAGFKDVAVGFMHACGIGDDGQAYCWGSGTYGQLGQGGTGSSTTPIAVSLPSGVFTFSQISAGFYQSCAIANDGKAYCWGKNEYGEVGDSTNTQRTVPTAVTLPSGVTGFKEIHAGVYTTCAIASNNRAYCWGYGPNGQLGNGGTTSQNAPVAVSLPSGVTSFLTVNSAQNHACGIGDNGKVYCWGGDNSVGALGNGTATDSSIPVETSLPAGTYTHVATGSGQGCAVGSDGKTYCWGWNVKGEVGDGTTTQRNTPVQVVTAGGYTPETNEVASSGNCSENGAICDFEFAAGKMPSNWSPVAAGKGHSCAIDDAGAAWCWGENSVGELGTGTTTASPSPVAAIMPAGVTFTGIDAGDGFNCATADDGKVYCWGKGNYGKLGNGGTAAVNVPTAVTMPSGVNVLSGISTSANHACAIGNNGKAYCWGDNTDGKLGDNSTTQRNVPTEVSIPSGAEGFIEVAAGVTHTCGVTDDNKTYCWGTGADGILGNGTTTSSSIPVPVTMPAGVNVISKLALGEKFSCGIGSDFQAYCWGQNGNGSLGNGTTTNSNVPVAVSMPAGIGTFTKLTASLTATDQYACGVANDNKLYCWGNNDKSHLGDGTNNHRLTPVQVTLPAGTFGFTSVDAGDQHVCGAGDDNKLYCWGGGATGALGDGNSTTQQMEPAPVSPLFTPARACELDSLCFPVDPYPIKSGAYHACGIGVNDQLYCWGSNPNAQLGDGTTTASNIPVSVSLPSGVSGFIEVAPSNAHTCAIGNNGKVYCWGNNANGRLGDGTAATHHQTPYPVVMPDGVTQFSDLANNAFHNCANGNDGNSYCWGSNFNGILGDGTTTDRYEPTKVNVPSGVSFESFALSNYHTCALGNDSLVYCWGKNTEGQLGDGTNTQRSVPTPVSLPSGVTGFTEVMTGWDYSCAVGNNNKTYCWGKNSMHGQLGNGTMTDSNIPLLVNMPTGVNVITDLAAETYHTCGIGDDGNAYCWGYNSDGQLGDNTSINRSSPVGVILPSGATGFTEVDVGHNHSCGLADNNRIYCWGQGSNGRMGDATDTSRLKPTNPVDNTNFTPETEPTICANENNGPETICGDPRVQVGEANACSLADDGLIYCWGWQHQGALGNGLNNTSTQITPAPIIMPDGVSSFKYFATGEFQSCAIGNDGVVYCWGRNDYGSLGDGTITTRATAASISMPDGVSFFKMIDAGAYHFCAIANTDKTYCWGGNGSGQLGNGDKVQQNSPVEVTMPAGVNHLKTLALGRFHSCAIADNDKTYCWGANSDGALGDSTFSGKTVPTETTIHAGMSATHFTALFAGDASTCGFGNDGKTYCWGVNNVGQLGNGTVGSDANEPQLVSLPDNVGLIDMALGGGHACGIADNGKTYCWGENGEGQLANGTLVSSSLPVAASVPDLAGAYKRISAYKDYYCAIAATNEVYCWGDNVRGQIVEGTSVDQNMPVRMDITFTPDISCETDKTCVTLSDIVPDTISAGQYHSCGIGIGGKAYCWGGHWSGSTFGQLGDGTTTIRLTPVQVVLPSGVTKFTSVSAGGTHSCGIGDNGRAYCWGQNTEGRLGDGTTTDRLTPVLVSLPTGVTSFTAVSAGLSSSCGIGNNGKAYCWGYNGTGKLGDGTNISSSIPVEVVLPTGVSAFTAVDAGTHSSCGIGDDGYAYCWGSNTDGQLGNGSIIDSNTPVKVGPPLGSLKLNSVQAGAGHSCGISDDGKAYCWGDNFQGQLGNGTTTDSYTPVQVNLPTGVTGFSTVFAGSHSCGIADDGKAYCWGYNGSGRLGDGTTTDRYSPVQVNLPTGETGFAVVTVGSGHSCGIGDNGRAYCWGINSEGQLGDSTTTARYEPTAVIPEALFEVVEETVCWGGGCEFTVKEIQNAALTNIVAGYPQTCAIGSDGEVYCWSSTFGGYGWLGDGTTNGSLSPKKVPSLPVGPYTSVQASDNHTCALHYTGRIYCWGRGDDYRLGDGNVTNSTVAVEVVRPNGAIFTTLTVGDSEESCAFDQNDKLYCWGNNSDGEVGDGTTTPRAAPVEVTNMPLGVKYTTIAIGRWFMCSIGDNEKTYCWGSNYYGSLGRSGGNSVTPVEVTLPGGISKFTQIAAGKYHACGIGDDQQIYCWGFNNRGQIGDNTTTTRDVPTALVNVPAGVSGWKWVTAFYQQTCAISLEGEAYCWGDNSGWQFGNNDNTQNNLTPVLAAYKPSDVNEWKTLNVGVFHSCATADNGKAYCWGSNGGAVGDGTSTNRPTPVEVDAATGFAPKFELTTKCGPNNCESNWWHVGPWSAGDNLISWNYNNYGNGECANIEAGSGSGTTCTSYNVEWQPMNTDFMNNCLIDGSGGSWCWGNGWAYHMGNGATGWYYTPTQAPTLPDGVSQFVYMDDICAIGDNGKAYCWAENDSGQLGDGTMTDAPTPTEVTLPDGVTGFTAISSGGWTTTTERHACAMGDNGHAYCWGDNTYGQLGDGTTTQRLIPTKVQIPTGATRFTSVMAGDTITCGIADDKQAYCWGAKNAYNGQLGTGDTASISAPKKVVLPPGISGWKQISVKRTHACGIGNNAKAYCWGRNDAGQLGNGSNSNSTTPVAVKQPVGVTGFQKVFLSQKTSCAIANNGDGYCWGQDFYGELGDGGTNTDSNIPVKVPLPGTAVDFAFMTYGGFTKCAITNDGQPWCWGRNNNGQVGDGTTIDRASLTPVSGVTTSYTPPYCPN